MRRHLVAAAVLALVGTAPLWAQGGPSGPPGKPDNSLISGGTYQADPAHTLVEWEVGHLGFSPYFGLFGDITGTLQLDPKAPASTKVSVAIPVSKITTASTALTEHLLSGPKRTANKPDFFGPAPAAATFASTSVNQKAKMRPTLPAT